MVFVFSVLANTKIQQYFYVGMQMPVAQIQKDILFSTTSVPPTTLNLLISTTRPTIILWDRAGQTQI